MRIAPSKEKIKNLHTCVDCKELIPLRRKRCFTHSDIRRTTLNREYSKS